MNIKKIKAYIELCKITGHNPTWRGLKGFKYYTMVNGEMMEIK